MLVIDLKWKRLSKAEKKAILLEKATTDEAKLLIYAEYGDIESAKQLIAVHPQHSTVYNSMLYCAANFRQLEMVAWLVEEQHADVNHRQARCLNNTTLKVAILVGDEEIVAYLLSKKADVNQKDGSKDTPLHEAVHLAQFHSDLAVRIIKRLLAAGADVTIRGLFNETPLETAKRQFDEKFLSLEMQTTYPVLEKLLTPPAKGVSQLQANSLYNPRSSNPLAESVTAGFELITDDGEQDNVNTANDRQRRCVVM